MKKVAIVSCYFQHNYGSMLQALATQMILDKLGYPNETINIDGFRKEIRKAKLKYFVKATLTSDIFLSKVGMVKNILIKKIGHSDYKKYSLQRDKKFDEFYKKYFRLSDTYPSLHNLGECCTEKYSTVLVGSDQLWLPANIEADYYTLSFVPKTVNTIAYATSFGQSNLPEDSKRKAKIFLKNIKHLSVREESGKQLIKTLVRRDVPVVCDPVLLFSAEDWMAIQNEAPLIHEPYILCYFLGNNPQHRIFAQKLKKKLGIKIVALVHLDEFVKSDEKYADVMPYNIDPADFLNLIRNAAYICTDSFHCTAFSILYKKTFFTFRRYGRKTKSSTNNRLDNLLNIAGITDRIFSGNENVDSCLTQKLDYEKIHHNIENIRRKSCEYLVDALQNLETDE